MISNMLCIPYIINSYYNCGHHISFFLTCLCIFYMCTAYCEDGFIPSTPRASNSILYKAVKRPSHNTSEMWNIAEIEIDSKRSKWKGSKTRKIDCWYIKSGCLFFPWNRLYCIFVQQLVSRWAFIVIRLNNWQYLWLHLFQK